MGYDASIKAVLKPQNLTKAYNGLATTRPTPLTDAWFVNPEQMDDDTGLSFYNPVESTPAPVNRAGGVARVLAMGSGKLRKLNLFTVFNQTNFQGNVLAAVQEKESQTLQDRGAKDVADVMLRFAERHRLLKELIIAKILATGKVYLNGVGEVLESSTGAVETCDFEVPSGNQTDIGGIIDSTWDGDSVDIPGHLDEIDDLNAQAGNPPLTDIWCHKLNLRHLRTNDAFAEWAKYNPGFNQAYMKGDATMVADGLFGKRWHFVNTYYTAADGTTKPFIPLEKAILTPPPTDPWVRISNGLTIVPDEIGLTGSIEEALRKCQKMYGPFAYAKLVDNPVMLSAFVGDKFAMNFLEPSAIYQADAFPSS